MRHVAVCSKIGGNHSVVPGLPSVTNLSEVVYLPGEADEKWGIYDRAGTAIEAAVNFRGPRRAPIKQSLLAEIPQKMGVLSDEHFAYLGAFFGHFGHFVTTTLSRFWYIQQAPERRTLKFLFHPMVGAEWLFARSHVGQILGALDLGRDNFVHFRQPMLIRGLVTLPSPSFEEQHFAHAAFATCARAIGERILNSTPSPSDVPVYFSKTRLQRGLRGFANELQVEDELSRHGVRVVYPEEHPFDVQLRILAQHSRVIGSVGSALHTAVFLPSGKRIVGLNPTETLNSNFLILDELGGHDATYVYPLEIDEENDGGHFQHAWRLRDPKAVARELLDLL